MTSAGLGHPPGKTATSGQSQPDATQEVDIASSPMIGEMPTFYLDNFPGLFDQSYTKNAH